MRKLVTAAFATLACGMAVLGADKHSAVASLAVADTVRYRVAVSIDEEHEPRTGELGEVFGLAVDKNGDVYAADISNAVIVVFGRDGRFRGLVGRKGKGPGEFRAPTGIVIDERNERLWVRDIEHVIRFARDSRTGLLARYDSAFRQPIYSDWRTSRASRLTSDGSYLHVAPSAAIGAPRFVLHYSANGALLDSLGIPRYTNTPMSTASFRISASGGRMLAGLNHAPFAPVPQWDVTPLRTIVSGDALQYHIVETDTRGSIIREFGRSVRPDAIPRAQLAESLRALTRRLDSIPVPLSRVEGMPDDVRQKRLPTQFPPYQAIFAELDGTIWVRRWPNERQRGLSVFYIFDSERRYVRTMLLPVTISNAPSPVLRSNFVVAVVVDESTGAQNILRFEPVPRR